MTSVSSVEARGAAVATSSNAEPWQSALLLPSPNSAAFTPSDALSQLLVSMQRAGEASLDLSTERILDVRGELHEKMQEFLGKIQKAAAESAKPHESGGLFGGIVEFFGNALGKILGTLTDAGLDFAKLPFELTVDTVKHFGDSQAMLAAFQSSTLELVQNGSTASEVQGFTRGVVSFSGDLAETLTRFQLDSARALAEGRSPLDALSSDGGKLWDSLKRNILDNPDFWAVTAAVAKGVAVAAAVAGGAATGGVLLPLAIGLMVALEADNRFGFIEKLVGKDKAPWVRAGLELAAAGCLAGAAGGSGQTLDWLRAGAGMLQAGGSVYAGVRAIEDSQKLAAELDQQASLQASMNQSQRLQRLLDSLLASLKGDAKDQEKTRDLAVSVAQIQAATQAALVVQA